ncbi:putative phage abortive infection protein [uncultured Chryseobacterium sp.]|uniref:putative phage abortive infection protein n=1 Tax=uncultured Chryseobacterium sp. TaxID=259322 RepID=UPI0037495E6A
MNENSSKKKDDNDFVQIFILILIVLTLWLLSWYWIDNNVTNEALKLQKSSHNLSDQELQGVFGDKFGAVNALFSALAFAGIIFTIILQKKELKLQREELSDTREEFIKQNKTLNRQRFENTFFQLLKLHSDIVDKLKIKSFDGSDYEKREFFVGAIKEFKYKSNANYFIYSSLNKLDPEEISAFKKERNIVNSFKSKLDQEEIKNLLELTDMQIDNFICEPIHNKEKIVAKEYKDFFHRFQYSLGHYFRNLYHIYKYIYITKLISEEDKQFYANIVRAQLSTDELVLIFYNSLTPIYYFSDTPNLGFPNFKYLIDKFDILQNMNKRLLLDKRHLEIFEKNIVTKPDTFKNQSNEI